MQYWKNTKNQRRTFLKEKIFTKKTYKNSGNWDDKTKALPQVQGKNSSPFRCTPLCAFLSEFLWKCEASGPAPVRLPVLLPELSRPCTSEKPACLTGILSVLLSHPQPSILILWTWQWPIWKPGHVGGCRLPLRLRLLGVLTCPTKSPTTVEGCKFGRCLYLSVGHILLLPATCSHLGTARGLFSPRGLLSLQELHLFRSLYLEHPDDF